MYLEFRYRFTLPTEFMPPGMCFCYILLSHSILVVPRCWNVQISTTKAHGDALAILFVQDKERGDISTVKMPLIMDFSQFALDAHVNPAESSPTHRFYFLLTGSSMNYMHFTCGCMMESYY